MRKNILPAALILISINSAAQFTLSGKISDTSGSQTISLNIPYIFGYYSENSQEIEVDKQGAFRISIPVREKKFIYLSLGDHSAILLVSPGKSLHILIDSVNGKITDFSGTAQAENRLLYQINLDKIPFFMDGQPEENPLATISLSDVPDKIVKPWYAERDQKFLWIKQSKISPADKALIASEVKYNALLQLNYFASYAKWTKKERTTYIIGLFDTVSAKPDVFPAGIQYYYFANNYSNYLETKAFVKYQELGSRNDIPLDYFGISIDSGNSLIKEKGKTYLSWLAIKKNYDKRVAEKWLAQQIQNKYRDKDLGNLSFLLHDFESAFPKSDYTAELKTMARSLEELLAANADNKAIEVFSGYEQISSIYEVIKTLKGKVVYLDIWGTWCGPCKTELRYTPQLKTHFKDRDIVFLYLDMDEEDKDEQWKKFIKVNALTGLHLRKNKKTILPIWEELQEKDPSYPRYYIFNKEGKLVVPNAKRPSDEKELYEQLENILAME